MLQCHGVVEEGEEMDYTKINANACLVGMDIAHESIEQWMFGLVGGLQGFASPVLE